MTDTTTFWNTQYSQPGYRYGTAPNSFLRDELQRLRPGALLLPCEGEGRNAVWAAAQGWDVTAVDISDVAREKAGALAQRQRVSLRYDVADFLDWDTDEAYDAIGLVYAHFTPEVRHEVHKSLINFLNPGGLVILEAFHVNQLGKPSGGPTDAEMLYTSQMLTEDFSDLEIVSCYDVTTILNEGPSHRGKASIVRMVARRRTDTRRSTPRSL